MKLDMVTSETDSGRKILSKEAFVDLVNKMFEEVIKNYENPLEKLVKEIKETMTLLGEAGEQASTLNRAADVIIKHQESFLHRMNIWPKRTVGVNVNIVTSKTPIAPSAEPKNYARFPPKTCQPVNVLPIPVRPIKSEPGTSSTVLVPSTQATRPIAPKRSAVDIVDLTSEEDKSQPKQMKTIASVEKPGGRLLGALSREPINSKSQPVLIQDGAAFPPKFTTVPVASTSLPQVIQLSQSQLNTLSGGGVISQQPVNAPKTVATTLPSGQRITYLVQSNLSFPPQTSAPGTRQNTITTPVAGTRVSLSNSNALVNTTRPVAPQSGTIIVASKLPGHIISPQNIGETRVVRPMPSNIFKHPAPLPEQPKPPPQSRSVVLELPPKPSLKLSKPNNGIVLSWNLALTRSHAPIKTYQLYGYEETSSPADSNMWKKVGEVKALPLPMACTLTQFADGRRYHFAIRAMDIYYRIGPFSDIASIYLNPATTTSSN